MTIEQRNKLLEKMTDEVAELVLHDNYDQTQMLSLGSICCATNNGFIQAIHE